MFDVPFWRAFHARRTRCAAKTSQGTAYIALITRESIQTGENTDLGLKMSWRQRGSKRHFDHKKTTVPLLTRDFFLIWGANRLGQGHGGPKVEVLGVASLRRHSWLRTRIIHKS